MFQMRKAEFIKINYRKWTGMQGNNRKIFTYTQYVHKKVEYTYSTGLSENRAIEFNTF